MNEKLQNAFFVYVSLCRRGQEIKEYSERFMDNLLKGKDEKLLAQDVMLDIKNITKEIDDIKFYLHETRMRIWEELYNKPKKIEPKKKKEPKPEPKEEPKEEDNSIEVKIIEKEQSQRQPLNFGGIKITQEQLDMASKMASKILPEVLKSFNMETDEIEIKIDTIDTMVKRAMEEQKPEIDIGEWKMEEDDGDKDES